MSYMVNPFDLTHSDVYFHYYLHFIIDCWSEELLETFEAFMDSWILKTQRSHNKNQQSFYQNKWIEILHKNVWTCISCDLTISDRLRCHLLLLHPTIISCWLKSVLICLDKYHQDFNLFVTFFSTIIFLINDQCTLFQDTKTTLFIVS